MPSTPLPASDHDPPAASGPASRYVAALSSTLALFALFAIGTAAWLEHHARHDAALERARGVASSLQATSRLLATEVADLPQDCSAPPPLPRSGYAVVTGSATTCTRGVDGTFDAELRALAPSLPRGATFTGVGLPAAAKGVVLVVGPTSSGHVVVAVPAAEVLPLRTDDAWSVYGPDLEGEPNPVLPLSPTGAPGEVVVEVGNGRVTATVAPVSRLAVLGIAACALVPLAALAALGRRVTQPLARMVTQRPLTPRPCREVAWAQQQVWILGHDRARLAFLAAAAAEEERRRLAVSLHDEPIQQLGAALLYLDTDAPAAPDLESARDALLAATTSLRQVSSGTMPDRAKHTALVGSLRDAIENLGDEHPGVRLHLECADPESVDAATTGLLTPVLVRNALESVRNALEHGDPSTVRVRLAVTAQGVLCEVCDDGSGVCAEDFEAAEREGHLGVVSVRELTAAVGGTVEITSEPRKATCVRIEVPTATEVRGML